MRLKGVPQTLTFHNLSIKRLCVSISSSPLCIPQALSAAQQEAAIPKSASPLNHLVSY